MRCEFCLLVVFGVLANAGSLWAQFNGKSSSGMFGNRTMGSSMGTSSGMGSSTGMGSSSSFGSSTGATANAFGNNGPLQAIRNSGIGGQYNSQSNGFVGANSQQAQKNFVGVAQANNQQNANGMSSMLGGMSAMAGYAAGRRTGQNGMMGQGQYGDTSSNSAAPKVRTQVTLAFPLNTVASDRAGTVLAGRLQSLPGLHWGSRPQVALEGHTAVLRGVVATDHDRDLAARVALLEPSVSEVVNLLEVAGSALTGPAAVGPAAPGSSGTPAPGRSATPGLPPASSLPGSAPVAVPSAATSPGVAVPPTR